MALTRAAPGELVNLFNPGSDLADAKAAALVKTDRFEAVRLVLRADSTIPAHAVDGYITLQCLEGAVILEAPAKMEMRSGDWIYLERGESHALQAIEDSALLLTIFFDPPS